eukprot:g55555.t1
MDGQFAALMGGWTGFPGFYNPVSSQNLEVIDNTIIGHAACVVDGCSGLCLLCVQCMRVLSWISLALREMRMCWLDWEFSLNNTYDLINRGTNNVIDGLNLSAFTSDLADVFFSSFSFQNDVTVAVGSNVFGTNNQVRLV